MEFYTPKEWLVGVREKSVVKFSNIIHMNKKLNKIGVETIKQYLLNNVRLFDDQNSVNKIEENLKILFTLT